MSLHRVAWCVALSVGMCLGCAGEKAKTPGEESKSTADGSGGEPPPDPSPAPVPLGINTLEGYDADLVHYSEQGSGFFPMAVVRALNDSETGRPFLENLERFGLVPGKKSRRNPEGFPVGIVTNTIKPGDRKIEMFGFTCAACHTSDLHYKGKVVRVEGGSGLFYVDRLGDAVGESVNATLKDPEEFWAFLKRLSKESKIAGDLLQRFAKLKDLEADGEVGRRIGEHIKNRLDLLRKEIGTARKDGIAKTTDTKLADVKALAAQLAEKSFGPNSPLKSGTVQARKKVIERLLSEFDGNMRDLKYRLKFLKIRNWLSQPGHRLEAGYGRADDFGTARVELFADWNTKNMLPVDAPVSVPPLWNIHKYEWLHWNANTNSVIQRSMGEAIGVGATFDLESSDPTSVNIVNQMLIEQQIQKITPPKWPSDVFGAPDEEQVKRGKVLYQEHCAGCHTPEKYNRQGLLVVKLFTLDEAKTDPRVATNFDRPVYKADGTTGGFAESIATLLAEIQKRAKLKMKAQEQQLMDELESKRLPVVWRDTLTATGGPVYPGRMLEGVWATAPYLHNGSVPTLYHLMLPASQRPKTFLVGSQEFDPKSVGFVWEKDKGPQTTDRKLFEFDTTIEGNWNAGHEYGAKLSEEDRWAVVEYLKVHKDPLPPEE